MSEIWELAYEDYNKGLKYKEIAEKYNVPIGTIKSWKSRKWKQKGMQPKVNKGCNKRRVKGAQQENKNAEKHGLFSKYLPNETLDIFEGLETVNPLDVLWDNIKIQYSAILRAQKIMFVKDKEELIHQLKKEKSTKSGYEQEWEYQYSWDRQATFLNSQSRAMSTLSGLIKQYDEMINKNWNMATQEQKLRIEKLKGEIDKNKYTTDKDIIVTVKKASERDGS